MTRDTSADWFEDHDLICPVCDCSNGHTLSCATLNIRGNVLELKATALLNQEKIAEERA